MPTLAPSHCHPANWRSLDAVGRAVAAENQRAIDLCEVGRMAEAMGVKIDIIGAIKSSASVSDILNEIRSELILRISE